LNKRPHSSKDTEIHHHFKEIKTSSSIKSLLQNTSQCDIQGDGKIYRHVKSQIDEWIDKHAKISELLRNLNQWISPLDGDQEFRG